MPRKKKPFIDKKNSVTFHLVHRSQKDPLTADESAPQHVLLEAQPINKRVEEQHKYGIYFDDDYDYLQHLKVPEPEDLVWESVENPNELKGKERADVAPLQLPSSVFASEYEEDVGMLNKAAPSSGPRPDWDPDIVATLDDDFDHDPANELEEDFMALANGGEGSAMDVIDEEGDYDGEEDGDWESDFSGEVSADDDEKGERRDILKALLRHKRFDNEETKSRFTEYSMSSSVIRRNEQLSLLDDRFEKFYQMYDEPEIGALDCEEIEGDVEVTNQMILELAEDFRREKQERLTEYNKKWDAERIKEYMEAEESEEELIEVEVEDDGDNGGRKKKWDCESILSTYSNLYNHPKMIDESKFRKTKIRLNPKTGIPIDTLSGGEGNTLTASTLAKLSAAPITPGAPKSLCAQSVISTLSVLSLRPKDETPEERAERKKLLKEYRAERRLEKKANSLAFKEEGKKQVKIKLNRNNNRGTAIV